MNKIQLHSGEKVALLTASDYSTLLSHKSAEIITLNNHIPSTIQFFSEDSCFSGDAEQTVNHFLAKEILPQKPFSFFGKKSYTLPLEKEKELIEFCPEIKDIRNLPLRKLSQSQRYLVLLLTKIFLHPEVLILDLVSPSFKWNSGVPQMIGKIKQQTCFIISSAPQQAFRLAHRILLLDSENRLQEIDNHAKEEDTLAELWDWWYAQAAHPLSSDLNELLHQQYI